MKSTSIFAGRVRRVSKSRESGRVGSRQLKLFAGLVGSGQEVLKFNGSGRIGSRGFEVSRVGSGQEVFEMSRDGSDRVRRCSKCHGSGQAMTREIRVIRGSGRSP